MRYSTPVGVVGKQFAKQSAGTQDPSRDALVYVSLAYHALEKLQEMGVDIDFNGKPLAVPSLERAYREILKIRESVPEEIIKVDEISKYGRLV